MGHVARHGRKEKCIQGFNGETRRPKRRLGGIDRIPVDQDGNKWHTLVNGNKLTGFMNRG